ncbi:DUF402 domain-containing protein [Tyzzerella sp. OttesenSCG-928-J15]|nr:DUF402 domain-containing protein [Tyzzerella sp. OttesenSCG-928-J15]
MAFPTLYRRRFIPDEIVELKNDEILHFSEEMIVTRWEVLKPRNDFASGISWYLPEKGFKVSKFFKASGQLHYIYCDIIACEFDRVKNTCIFNDLLVDVIIFNDGSVKVMDIGELTEALDMGLITLGQLKESLNKLDSLLDIVYSGRINELMADSALYI